MYNGPFFLKLELPGLPRTTNANSRGKLRDRLREKRLWKRTVWLLVREQGGPPVEPIKQAALKLTRFSSAEPDYDGLVSSFKHVIDGLVESGVLAGDKRVHIGVPDYQWVRCPAGKGKCTVEVNEVVIPRRGSE